MKVVFMLVMLFFYVLQPDTHTMQHSDPGDYLIPDEYFPIDPNNDTFSDTYEDTYEDSYTKELTNDIKFGKIVAGGYWMVYGFQVYGGDLYKFEPDGTYTCQFVDLERNGRFTDTVEGKYSLSVGEPYAIYLENNTLHYDADNDYMYFTIRDPYSGRVSYLRAFHYFEIPSFEQMRRDEKHKWIE